MKGGIRDASSRLAAFKRERVRSAGGAGLCPSAASRTPQGGGAAEEGPAGETRFPPHIRRPPKCCARSAADACRFMRGEPASSSSVCFQRFESPGRVILLGK